MTRRACMTYRSPVSVLLTWMRAEPGSHWIVSTTEHNRSVFSMCSMPSIKAAGTASYPFRIRNEWPPSIFSAACASSASDAIPTTSALRR